MTLVHRHPDRRSPWVFDVLELGRAAGSMREIKRTVPAPADLRLDMIGVPEGSELGLDLRAEAVGEGVLVSGLVAVSLEGECSRCLRHMEEDDSFDVQELFFHPGRAVEEGESLIENDLIDLEELVRYAVVLELPFSPLCEQDCLGLCLECGFNLNDDPTHTHGDAVEPRWGKLADLGVDADN